MTNEGDELLWMIRQAVRQRGVPKGQEEMLTELVGRTVIMVMSEPRFYSRLTVVAQLQAENNLLRQHLAFAQATLARLAPATMRAPRKVPAKKKAGAKRVVKKSPAVKVKGSTAKNRNAFKQGYRGR